jgi:hypothetical protein
VASSWQALVLRRRREVAGRIGRSPLLRLVFLLRPLVFISVFFSYMCLSLPLCNVCLSLSSLFSSSVSLCFSRFVPPCFFFSVCSSLFFLGFSVRSCLSFLVFMFFFPLFVF